MACMDFKKLEQLTPFVPSFAPLAAWVAPTMAKYEITFFVFSVFPAPDSPVISMDWFSLSETVSLRLSTQKDAGNISEILLPCTMFL